jgi:aldehyde dehydrogenase (NAD+)
MGSVPEETAALDNIGDLVSDLREVYESGRTQDMEWRQSQLRGLVRLLEDEEEAIFDALHEDLGKHRVEAFRDEVGRWFLALRCVSESELILSLRCVFIVVIRSCIYVQVGVLKKSVVDKLQNLKKWAAPEKARKLSG